MKELNENQKVTLTLKQIKRLVLEDNGITKRNWDDEALKYAEKIGVYEYQVNGPIMEYWTFYGREEGWYFVRYDLENKKTVFSGANIPWQGDIPMFLKTDSGVPKYNYK